MVKRETTFTGQPDILRSRFMFYRQPLYSFLLFTATNAILSYGHLSLPLKLWVGLAGWGFPFFLGLFAPPVHPLEKPSWREEPFSIIPPGAWAVVFGAAFLLRLIPLLNSYWPIADDGLNTITSLELSKKWRWFFFFTPAQLPPLFNWLQTLFFKVVTPSIFSARFFQVLLSWLAVLFFLIACGRFVSKSLMFFAVVFFSLSFWPLFCCRFSTNMSLVLIFEMAAFIALDLALQSLSAGKEIKWMIGFGLAVAAGFWVAIQWLLVPALLVPLFLSKLKSQRDGRKWFLLLGFGVPFLMLAISFCVISARHWTVEHIFWMLHREAHADLHHRLMDFFSNWTNLFWLGDTENRYGYSSSWGGTLNPIEGALCFLGLLELFRHRRFIFSRRVFILFAVFMVPGLLTSGYEIFHNLLALPLLSLFCGVGVLVLLAGMPGKTHRPFLWLFLFVLPIFSAVQLTQSYDPAPTPQSKAFYFLNRTQVEMGPGLIFLDLQTDTEDQTLSLAIYSFNAAENPELDGAKARWAAVLTNDQNKLFLSERFSGTSWHWLSLDSFWRQGSLALVIFPIQTKNKAMEQWLAADQMFHSITAELCLGTSSEISDEQLKYFLGMESKVWNDPFLESVFCEKAVFYQRNRVMAPELLPLIQRAVEKGYPSAHLLAAEGLLLRDMGRFGEARKVLEKAVHSPGNQTTAADILKTIPAIDHGVSP